MARTRRALTADGTLISNGGGHVGGKLGRTLRTMLVSMVVRQQASPTVKTQNHDDLRALKALVEAGRVVPVIDSTYPLDGVPEAIRRVAAGHASGTIVIAVPGLPTRRRRRTRLAAGGAVAAAAGADRLATRELTMVDVTAPMAGKIVLITGGTGGIGKATAIGLAALGARVAITGRDRERAEAAAAEIRDATGNPLVDAFAADLSSQAEVRRVAAQVLDAYPRLDVLINNVGGFWATRHVTADGLEHTFAVNHLAAFLLTDCCSTGSRPAHRRGVVMVSSGPSRWDRSTSRTCRASAATRGSRPTTSRSWPASCSPTSSPGAWRAPA